MLSLPAENHLVVLIFVPAGIPADAARLAARHIGNQLQELAHNRKAHRPADEGVAEVNVLQPSPQGRNAFFLWTAIARLIRDAVQITVRMILGSYCDQADRAAALEPVFYL